MKKNILLFILLLFPVIHLIGQNNELNKTMNELDEVLENRYKYSQLKEDRLKELKKSINSNTSTKEQYDINKIIIEEYNPYISDSAILYAEKNVEIAKVLNNKRYDLESRILLAEMYARAGLLTQPNQILSSIDPKGLPPDLRGKYYSVRSRSSEVLIEYINDEKYTTEYAKEAVAYLDSAQLYSSKENDNVNFEAVFRDFFEKKPGYLDGLLTLLSTIDPESRDYAVIASFVAIEYWGRKEHPELQLIYMARACIIEAKLAIKDQSTLINIATLLHENGDFDRAYRYAKIALDDANLYNAKQRHRLILTSFPVIEQAYQSKIDEQSKSLKLYLIIVIAFAIGLIFTCLYIYKQICIVKRTRKELEKLNMKLDEANGIKENYIGYFLRQYMVYIDKLDEFKQSVYRKIKAGKTNDLLEAVQTPPVTKKEIEEFYLDFDMAFLEIFPTFVDEFNALLKEEERYKIESNELNTELRIFALIRLGITDNKQISSFLRYSIRTIYNYRSKVKSKALIESDDFEEKVKNIGIITK